MKTFSLTLRILRVSLRALARNKMRTFLTCLGIIIGVGAVIAMVSIGAGAKAAVESRFASMGTNLLFVGPGNRNVGGVRTGFGGWNTLTVEDAEASAQPLGRRVRLALGQRPGPGRLRLQELEHLRPGQRRELSRRPQVGDGVRRLLRRKPGQGARPRSASWGPTSRPTCSKDEDPLGKTIRIKRVPFVVIGVLKSKGQSGGFGSRDDIISIPYTTCMKRIQKAEFVGSIDVSAVSVDPDGRGQDSRSRSSCGSATASPPAPPTTSASRTWPRSPRARPTRPTS